MVVALETGYDLLYGLRDAAVLSNGSTIISIAGPFENPVLICFSAGGEILWDHLKYPSIVVYR